MQNTPVTLVIPCYNSSETIEHVIEAAMGESFHEIICINNNSDDDTLEKLKKLPVLIVEEKKQGTVWARRAGAACAETEWLAMIDDDVILQPGWKQSMLDFLEKAPDAHAITGYVDAKLPPHLVWAKKILCNCTNRPLEYFANSQPFGTASMVLRSSFLAHSQRPRRPGRDDKTGTLKGCGEDIEVFRKMMNNGGRVFHNPQAKAIHQIEEWRKNGNYLMRLQRAYSEKSYVEEFWY